MIAASYDIFKFSTTPSYVLGSFKSWDTLFPAVVQFMLVSAVILFIVLILIGGIQYLTSAGNEESTKTARRLILNAVIGLFIMLSAQAMTAWLLIRTNKTEFLRYIPGFTYSSFVSVGLTTGTSTDTRTNSSNSSTSSGTTQKANCTKSPASTDVQCGTATSNGPDSAITTPNTSQTLMQGMTPQY